MAPKTIIFIGPQGSGKGTQIERLTKTMKELDPTRNVVDIQTGRRFRALAARGEGFTEKHLTETLDTGILQPLFLSVVLWGDAMREKLDDAAHLLVDGFPRIVPEAIVLESALSFYKRQHIYVVNLNTPEEVVRERMKKRARPDDTDASIEARLTWYRKETLPVVEYYRKRTHTDVLDIDGTMSIDEVQKQITDTIQLTG
jgi:adenylate kinase